MNTTLSTLLYDTATLLELAGENSFKANAFRNAARLIETQTTDITTAYHSGMLDSIPGLGKGLQENIREFFQTGGIGIHNELRKLIPPGVFEMTTLRGLGPKKARELWKNLGVNTIDELHTACLNNAVAQLKGFGKKTQHNILDAIQQWQTARQSLHLHSAIRESETILSQLKVIPYIQRVAISGEVRRRCEVIHRLVFVVVTTNFSEVIKELEQLSFTADVSDAHIALGRTEQHIPITLHLSSPEQFPEKLFQTTGSDWYYRSFAQNFTIPAQSAIPDERNDDRSIYESVGLPYIIPELREVEHEDLLASYRELAPPEFIRAEDIRGMLHVHSTWSDGRHNIREMAEAAQQLGCSYIAICDHSQTASYANGLNIERVKRQHEEIDRLNSELSGITILKGIESDILADGSLDYPDSILESFDLIVASVHSSMNQPREQMTKRVIRALSHPCTTILGHPTGRLLLSRKEYAIDIEEVIGTAAEYKKMIEINANPHRLDLSWHHAVLAKKAGVGITINTDAHHVEQMLFIRLGIDIARKAGLTTADVVNTRELQDFFIFAGRGARSVFPQG